MKVSNIDINQFITLLLNIKKAGNVMVDLEIFNDEDKDRMIIHPVKVTFDGDIERPEEQAVTGVRDIPRESDITISDPNISTDDDSIYEMFKNVS